MKTTITEETVSTIVIATDGSKAAKNATELGLEIASSAGDDVVFVSVWDVVKSAFGEFSSVEPRYLECDRERAEAVLVASKALASRYGIEAETVVLSGEAVQEICKLASERNARLIVMGSHGWGAMRGFMFGSVVAGVLRHAPCPVLSGTPETRELLDPSELVAEATS
jgi:nucleotide-binding universal stress UspA family protein